MCPRAKETPRKGFRLRIVILSSLILLITLMGIAFLLFSNEDAKRTNRFVSHMHYRVAETKAVWKLFEEVSYSSFDVFNDKDVKLAVDFQNEKWLIKNYFKFDERDHIVLNNNSGACLELVIHAFTELEKDLSKDYHVKFVETIEASTFNNPNSRHWILLLTHKGSGNEYILDPSFKRFGPIDNFDDYRITQVFDRLPRSVVADGHNHFSIADGAPIFMKKGNLIGLIVRPVNGNFNKENFSLGIYAKKPFKFKGHFIYNIGLVNGQYFEKLDEKNAKEFLNQEQVKALKALLIKLYNEIES